MKTALEESPPPLHPYPAPCPKPCKGQRPQLRCLHGAVQNTLQANNEIKRAALQKAGTPTTLITPPATSASSCSH